MHVCPNCGNNFFKIITKRNGIVKITVDETGASVPELFSEEGEIIATEYTQCVKCDLVINPDGSNLVEDVPVELKGLSESVYIKKIMDLERQIKELKSPPVIDAFLADVSEEGV